MIVSFSGAGRTPDDLVLPGTLRSAYETVKYHPFADQHILVLQARCQRWYPNSGMFFTQRKSLVQVDLGCRKLTVKLNLQ